MISIIAFMVIIEIIEQFLAIDYGENVHQFYDGIVFFIVIPIGAWLLLQQLKNLDVEREQAQVSQDLHTDFSQRLGDARSWDELVEEIITYPHLIAPQADITLFVFNPDEQNLQPEITCSRVGALTRKPDIPSSPGGLPVGSLPQLLMQHDNAIPPAQVERGDAFHPRKEPAAQALANNRYDLPITHNIQQIGVIKLEFQTGTEPSAKQILTLKAAAPIMALALEGALLQKMAAEQAAASETQRQAIAQTLHDTLAQNIGYLRLKLDQLTGENSIREIGAVLQELERMRMTADEAYQQVRNTLDALNPNQAENLVSTLFMQAQTINQRAGFNLRTSQVGTPRPLPAATRQQILYIVREALYNVEKHANARQVHLQLIWLDQELIIKVCDDGVGFNPRAVPIEGHYGLWIMQQRAQEIGGTIKIRPAAESSGAPGTNGTTGTYGTEVTLWVPCPSSKIPVDTLPADLPSQQVSETGAASETAKTAIKPKAEPAP